MSAGGSGHAAAAAATHRVVAAVDVVAHEQVVGVGRVAADAEQLHEVVELAVDVATHCDRRTHGLHVRLLH